VIARPAFWRKTLNQGVKVTSGVAAMVGCAMLCWILLMILSRGLGSLNWHLFTDTPRPPGVEGGGVANALLGTLIITVLATLLGVPLGLLGGVYLAEYGRGTRLATAIHFCANVMVGVPSIIVGVFVYGLMVKPMGAYTGYAGAVALAIIMFPVVLRTSEDMLALVPDSLREATLALGAPRWRATFGVLFRSAKVGLLTGVLLAIARVSGETAPLLFTCLNDDTHWPTSLNGPTANLTVTIFTHAMSPYHNWQNLAWAASLLITVGVLLLTVSCRVLLYVRSR
jgi:phosphate transport system permease protein